jgi:hypothetical protein
MKTRSALLILWIIIPSLTGLAQTWRGTVNSDWNNRFNWSTNEVPASYESVTINSALVPYQPVLSADVSIVSLTMAAGTLNLNGFSINCSGTVSLSGDSLKNGKISAPDFSQVFSMKMSGKIVFDKTNTLTNNIWAGNNKVTGDSLVIIWRGGSLSLESIFSDSIYSHFKIQLANTGAVYLAGSEKLFVRDNLIIDNSGKGTFVFGVSGDSTVIGGNLIGLNFAGNNSNLIIRNVTTAGANDNGPFYCYSGDITNSHFTGNFNLKGDSSFIYTINNSFFSGPDNLFQAGNLDVQNSRFGKAGAGTTILKAAHNVAGNVFMRDGNNKFFGDAQWETYAVYPGGLTIQQTYYGPDTCLGNLNFILKGNAALTTNGNGHSYVAGNLIIDGQGARKWIQFTGGTGISFNVDGNFMVKNFTAFPEPGIAITNVHLRNLFVAGTDDCGSFYCYTGDITNCSFNGNFKLTGDSSQTYYLNNSSFLGANNLFQSGSLDAQSSRFGQSGTGTTILKGAHNVAGNVFMRDGNNKFFGDAQWETYAVYPGGLTIQQTYYGPDTCLGNLNFVLKGNAALTTNGNGHSYVAGNLIIDGQGARKWIQFTGGTGISFNVDGNFTVKNFTAFPEPGIAITNVHLRNLNVAGTDDCGSFYCYTGDIQNCSFNGNFKLTGDSSQVYIINSSSLLGADNLIQAGNLELQSNRFGQTGTGTTVLRAAHNVAGNVFMRDGNNKFFGNVQFEAIAPSYGSLLLQQTFYGADSCFENIAVTVIGLSSANLGGNNLYLGKGLSLQNNGTGVIVHDNISSAVHFIGTDTASYNYSGTGSVPTLRNIVMNRKGGLRLQSPLTFTGNLAFTRGVILSSLTNPVIIANNANISAGWDSSYVDGPVRKIGNTAFTFPVGNNNISAPISITAPALTTDEFSVQYFHHIAHDDGYDSTRHDVSINHLSRAEYWLLNRTAGSSSPKVTLSWKAIRSGIVDVIPDLRVARWNGTTWKDEGNGLTAGTTGEGSIQSLNTINSFSPFTLASTTVSNPLPVTYIYFIATLQPNRTVLLKWETGDEISNAFFDIERSRDARTWSCIGTINSSISHQYSFNDLGPVMGINYYRIRQVDQNGKYLYTSVRLIKISNENKLYIWPNPSADMLNIQIPFTEAIIEIYNAAGKMIWGKTTGNTINTVPVKNWPAGVYMIQVRNGNDKLTEKFIKE